MPRWADQSLQKKRPIGLLKGWGISHPRYTREFYPEHGETWAALLPNVVVKPPGWDGPVYAPFLTALLMVVW